MNCKFSLKSAIRKIVYWKFNVIIRDVTFMRMTYSHIFETRVKSTKFDEKIMNIVILTKYYLHIIRMFQYFVLFAYYSHILHVYLKLLYFAKLLLLKSVIFTNYLY